MKAKTWAPFLEALEDRLTPSLSFTNNGGNLSVTGTAVTPTVTILSTGTSVIVLDDLAHMFTVTHDLTVDIQMNAAPPPTFNYDPVAYAPGRVSLTVKSSAGITFNVAGTGSVNINGPLAITTGAGNDTVSIDNVNPAGLKINTGGGQDYVLIGFKNTVNVKGDVVAKNVNLIGLGFLNGPAVTVSGDVSVSTDVTPGITFNTPNNIDIENNTVIQGDVSATLNGPFEVFSTQGVIKGEADVDLGGGSNLVLFQDGASTGGDVSIEAKDKASTTISIGTATFGHNLEIELGNGDNVFVFHGTLLGHELSYEGGDGKDSVTIAKEASLTNAKLDVNLEGGQNTFTLDSYAIGKAEIRGHGGHSVAFINVFFVTFDLDIDFT